MDHGLHFQHAMLRVRDLDKAIHFWVDLMGLELSSQKEYEKGRFTLVFLKDKYTDAKVELTYNWDEDAEYSNGRNFGHLAYTVDNIYETCSFLRENGIEILRPPRDGHMAFIKTPDGISLELLQKGESLPPQEPWSSMESSGSW